MSIFDEDLTLPGVITHVEADYSYGYDSSLFGSTDSELVIGTAFNGPVGQPTAIYSPEHAAYIFGDAYDSQKHEEASLVAGIQDAWNRGCRTIYGVRVGGREVYKDFNFNIDTVYRLRLSSQFPSNVAKDCCILVDNTAGAEKVTFYKPVSRATINEKKLGRVESSSKMMKNIILASDYGFTSSDSLSEFIKAFNTNSFNNVLKLSIVDADGSEVTGSPEVSDIAIGNLFSGVYLLGRSHTAKEVNAVSLGKFVVINATGTNKPFSRFSGAYYRKLLINTDVSLAYPIYFEAGRIDEFRASLGNASISMVEPYDFLDYLNGADAAFVKDSIDYEETALSKFEMYRRLGSGYAVTAHAVKRAGTDAEGNELAPRIRETEVDDSNHIMAIEDGIYSILQDANVKYRAVTCVCADDVITGALPSRDDFRVANRNSMSILNDYITVTANVDSGDMTAKKRYNITFIDTNANPVKFSQADLTGNETIYKSVGVVDDHSKVNPAEHENGTMFIEKTASDIKLFRVCDNTVLEMTSASLNGVALFAIENDGTRTMYHYDYNPSAGTGSFVADPVAVGSYTLVEALGHIFVYDDNLVNIGALKALVESDDNDINVAATDIAIGSPVNNVIIYSSIYDAMTVEELVSQLQSDEIFARIFDTVITEAGSYERDSYVMETAAKPLVDAKTVSATLTDKSFGYNYNLYIPYRTTDNFLRQLAQHCTYTELKTAPTFGFMGIRPMTNLGLSSIAARVNKIACTNFDLYAKNNYGRKMLDRNNLPYPIGKNVSLVFSQYTETMQNTGYDFISNGAAGYAGMVSVLPLDQSSTGQSIDLSSIAYNLTQSQLNKLTAAGIVTFRQSFTKGIVVTDGITMAPSDSVFRRLASSRIVAAVEELIRAACEPFIGKENHAANRNALSTAIKSKFKAIVGTLIEDYDFTMNTDSAIAKLNYVEIFYEIIPIYEIRQVRNTIKVVDSLSTTSAVNG